MGLGGRQVNISDGEFTTRLVRASHRLSRHINDVRDGETGSLDDLASVLRLLVTENNRANKVIMRAVSRFKLTEPTLRVSPEPPVGEDVEFAIGGVPVPAEVNFTECSAGSVRTRSWSEWVNSRCVTLTDGDDQRTISWHDFVNEAANTFGAHAASSVVEHFRAVGLAQLLGRGIDGAVLMSTALATEAAVRDVLLQLDLPLTVAEPRPLHPNEPDIPWVCLWRKDGGVSAEVMISDRQIDDGTYLVWEYPVGNLLQGLLFTFQNGQLLGARQSTRATPLTQADVWRRTDG